jgi:hypothetical protein
MRATQWTEKHLILMATTWPTRSSTRRYFRVGCLRLSAPITYPDGDDIILCAISVNYELSFIAYK